MTKVQVSFDLLRPLDEDDLDGVDRVHSVYGILAAKTSASLQSITVDYDASRMKEPDVESALLRHSIPIRRRSVSL